MKKMPPLSAEEARILHDKGTEPPYSGRHLANKAAGTYVCRACGNPLYPSHDKFDSGCGWPSFDDTLPGAVRRTPDPDGRRVEITCAHCGGHLGHVFEGERLTPKDTRHCVNSLSLHFVPEGQSLPQVVGEEALGQAAVQNTDLAEAVFGGGCFWGVEHIFSQAPGVVDAVSGYSGGQVADPSYREVCGGDTGHAEVVKVVYDSSVTSYEALARLFFELHDPGQLNRQGPDYGSQYRSILFYADEDEKQTAEKLIALLKSKGHRVVTELAPRVPFYPAEESHQDYLRKYPGRPCHLPVRRFD